ncbi:MAG TPA: beta-galactosidase [Treponema sp.]|nr:beta-galactosidase [Treponema sp.]
MEDNCRIFMNRGWLFSDEFSTAMTEKNYCGEMEEVNIPHSFATSPFNSFSPQLYQKLCAYRKSFATQENWAGKKVILTVAAAAHKSEVYLNGKLLKTHSCGYTSFSTDLTDALLPAGEENVLCIKVDSRETLDQPPFGFVIDYMTYGGIYRDVYIEVKNAVFIEDVFVTTKKNAFTSRVTLNACDEEAKNLGYMIQQEVFAWQEGYGWEEDYADFSALGEEDFLASVASGIRGKTTLTSGVASGVMQWNLESPALYCLRTALLDSAGNEVDSKTVRFGFREIRFDSTGFYLNGIKVKLRGLNRHQSFPYVGYAMPKMMQREDADILKYELSLNEVRTSHYPQSRHFVDRCDEIGLLVFTEIPGWQHIGTSAEWRCQALENVRDMVLQYRNNPSVFLWGVRINESQDDEELYQKTNALCKSLDPSRPTGGVRFLKKSQLLEDVYTYNDFSFAGWNLAGGSSNSGSLASGNFASVKFAKKLVKKTTALEPKKKVTKTKKGFMVTEYNGHMFPTKSFDAERIRTEHALRHAAVLDALASSKDHAGASGWCAFDYNTHKEFGAGDYICYHGVMDMFRNPKLAASVYKSQQDAEVVGDVLEISSSMDLGEYPAGNREAVWIFTNADSVKFYVNDSFIKEFKSSDSPYKNLKHGPLLVDDFIGPRLAKDYGFSEKKAEDIKKLLHEVLFHGMDNLPLSAKLLGVKLALTKTTNLSQMGEFFTRYLGNLGAGGSVTTSYKFEAYRDGKLVSTVVKAPAKTTSVRAWTKRSVLEETHSYDVTEVHLEAVDEKGNVQHYCQEAVTLTCEGPVEIIGPKAVSLKGGTAGTYIKTTGQTGKASLTVTDWTGNVQKIDFEIK